MSRDEFASIPVNFVYGLTDEVIRKTIEFVGGEEVMTRKAWERVRDCASPVGVGPDLYLKYLAKGDISKGHGLAWICQMANQAGAAETSSEAKPLKRGRPISVEAVDPEEYVRAFTRNRNT